MSVIGGILSGASWSLGRAFVEHNEMVLFTGRWFHLGHSLVTVTFFALLVLDALAVTKFVKMGRKHKRLVAGRQQ